MLREDAMKPPVLIPTVELWLNTHAYRARLAMARMVGLAWLWLFVSTE